MESADVAERMERPRTMKRDMELELGPRISNFGKGIEQIGIEKYLWERKRSVITSNEVIVLCITRHQRQFPS
jgi:hypothetical protein